MIIFRHNLLQGFILILLHNVLIIYNHVFPGKLLFGSDWFYWGVAVGGEGSGVDKGDFLSITCTIRPLTKRLFLRSRTKQFLLITFGFSLERGEVVEVAALFSLAGERGFSVCFTKLIRPRHPFKPAISAMKAANGVEFVSSNASFCGSLMPWLPFFFRLLL